MSNNYEFRLPNIPKKKKKIIQLIEKMISKTGFASISEIEVDNNLKGNWKSSKIKQYSSAILKLESTLNNFYNADFENYFFEADKIY